VVGERAQVSLAAVLRQVCLVCEATFARFLHMQRKRRRPCVFFALRDLFGRIEAKEAPIRGWIKPEQANAVLVVAEMIVAETAANRLGLPVSVEGDGSAGAAMDLPFGQNVAA